MLYDHMQYFEHTFDLNNPMILYIEQNVDLSKFAEFVFIFFKFTMRK